MGSHRYQPMQKLGGSRDLRLTTPSNSGCTYRRVTPLRRNELTLRRTCSEAVNRMSTHEVFMNTTCKSTLKDTALLATSKLEEEGFPGSIMIPRLCAISALIPPTPTH